MKYRKNTMVGVLSVVMMFFFLNSGVPVALADSNPSVLAKVEFSGMLDRIGLPVYEHLQDANGVDYALVISTKDRMDALNAKYQILDTLKKSSSSTDYVIAFERIKGARVAATNTFNVLYDDGRRIIARIDEKQANNLAAMGFELKRLSAKPMVFTESAKYLRAITALAYDSDIQDMVNSINQTDLNNYVGNLSGEWAVSIGGSDYTITSRHTASGTPVQKATQYVYEYMQGLGLSVSYHNWTYGSYSNRNVVAEKTGTVASSEIVLVVGHLDALPSGSRNYGADDNGSGTAGVMAVADTLNSYDFERTIRFVLFTGEEQGLYGSNQYAASVSSENIVAVYNMDMIAWDNAGGPVLRLHTRTSSNSGYSADKAIADTFVDAVNTYGLSGVLTPVIDSDGITASDHSPFWNQGFAAILAIEDDENDFCGNYHTVNDRLSTLNMSYFTNYVKASVGTVAHLARRPVAGPRAGFTYGINDLTVDFTDTSTNSTGTNVSWNWDFGDGNTSTAQNPTHTYTSYGTYQVELTVTDNNSLTDTTTQGITLTDPKGSCGVSPVQTQKNQLILASVSAHRLLIPFFIALLAIGMRVLIRRRMNKNNE
jgi:hypothetical protein